MSGRIVAHSNHLLTWVSYSYILTTMGSRKYIKLNHLLRDWVPGTVTTQASLDRHGVYRQLANKYVASGWLERLGRGAYVRAGDRADVLGGVHGLQVSDELDVHPGGVTALGLAGFGHTVAAGREITWLFGPPGTRLPSWFAGHDWGVELRYRAAALFDDNALGLTSRKVEGFELRTATPERAMLEVLHDVPEAILVNDAMALMTGLTTARPAMVQELLQSCRSVKAKRLFLLMAETASHGWASRLDRDDFDLGKGKRVLGGGGHYFSSYQISLPEPLVTEGGATP